MDDEKLIECVRLHPALYYHGDPKYLDAKYKNYLWRQIASELMPDEKDFSICKSRWTNIRDQYKKCLKTEKTLTGQAAKKRKKYKYADLLEFLNGYEDDGESHSFTLTQGEHTLTENATLKTEATQDFQTIDNDIQAETVYLENDASSPPRKREKATPNASTSDILMKYIIENNKKKEENNASHPIDAFLNGISPILKSLSPFNQHLAKGQIFKIVHDLERQELCQSVSSSP